MNIFGQHMLSCKDILFNKDKQFTLVINNGQIMSRNLILV